MDWRGSLTEYCRRFGAERGLSADWEALVVEWRSLYPEAIAPVRDGKRLWAGFDELHRETLDSLLPKYGLNTLSDADRDLLNLGWQALDPWPDAVPGLARLRQRFLLGPLSNATTRQLIGISRHAGLTWDCVLGGDIFHTYKPMPAVYLGAASLLHLAPESVLMVAAHNLDLQGAQKAGFRTAFILRDTEEPEPEGAYTYTARDFHDLASQLGA